jgi:hypothetical protein
MANLLSKIKLLIQSQDGANQDAKLFPILPIPATVGDALTCSRALDTATRVNSAGAIETVAANMPRITWELGADQCPNLLVEKTTQQLLLSPNAFGGPNWVRDNSTVTDNVAIAPDGTLTADLVYPTSTGSARQCYSTGVTVLGTYYTNVYRIKASGKTWIYVFGSQGSANSRAWVNLATGEFGTVQIDIVNYWISELDAFGYYTIAVTEQANGGTSYNGVGIVDSDNVLTVTASGTDGVLCWGFNMFEGRVPLSYVSTNTTRNADVILKAGIGSLLNGAKGLFVDCYLQAGSLSDGVYREVAELYTNSTNRVYFYRYNNSVYFTVENTTVQCDLLAAITTPFKNKRIKLFARVVENDIKFYVNGVLVNTDTSALIPSLNGVAVGNASGGSYYWDGLIKAVAVTDEFTEADIEQISSYPSFENMAEQMVYDFVG